MPRQLWVPEAARAAGLVVVEVEGWQTRGAENFNPRGCVCHHTAGPSGGGDMPSLGILIRGRPEAGIPGPLSQLGLGRSGTVYMVASGVANHAGRGGWRDLAGNSSVWGIEAENDGYQAWPAEQVRAYKMLCAVLAQGTPFDSDKVCAHFEWAPTRKFDPHGFMMDGFRVDVQAIMEGENMDEVIAKIDDVKAWILNDYNLDAETRDQFVAMLNDAKNWIMTIYGEVDQVEELQEQTLLKLGAILGRLDEIEAKIGQGSGTQCWIEQQIKS